ncbi:MAG: hypothetical protein DPW09_41205 [Anaerolineae bacterium]|nr:hypothetical protein [Anaerolineales bacterium]MCQ3979878.1 hypothetical protein [Anaerolineae bacterium]
MYRITIQGRLGREWSDWFDGMVLTSPAGLRESTTSLTGLVRDQAALHGLLNTLYGLGLPLLDLTCLEINPTPEK